MAWFYLAIAGLFEVGWAIGIKYTDGFTRLVPSVLTVLGMIISFYFLAQAVKVIPIGTAYVVWVGIGAVGAAVLGMLLFNEPATVARIICLLLIVAGVIGLKFQAG